jgi:glycosyltransferase involved in cell wall biosynthesis
VASAGKHNGKAAGRRQLLFVSARFLFPVDSGGKIRTTQILRGMKGGAFDITLASPAPPRASERYARELDSVCDRFLAWPEPARGPLFPVTRLRHLGSHLPVPVATDIDKHGRKVVGEALAGGLDAVVVDFPHADVLAPATLDVPSVMFTHNVEAEIYRRHVDVARQPWLRAVWNDQYRKMLDYEREVLRKYDTVVAVSTRDGEAFRRDYGIEQVATISTGVDLDFFGFQPPGEDPTVVFTGSMDWLANADGIEFFLEDVWPVVAARIPAAKMRVIGRSPPAELVRKAARLYPDSWTFTGFVDDVRPEAAGAAAFVIPLRVGGGTRLKAYEAMAMGCPVISTTIGVEGLPVEDGIHYLRADGANALADALIRVLEDTPLRLRLASAARALVESTFSYRRAAGEFEQICLSTIDAPGPPIATHA